MDNMEIYNKMRSVPAEAKKPISAGRLKGMTDINPMWRFKKLTEVFGAAGIGWYYRITDKWLETGADGVVSAFVQIELYVKVDGEWSAPIQGIGGSAMVAKEKTGLYTSDECYKMALTDAISVSCKALGMAADVYYDKDRTKYTASENAQTAVEGATGQPMQNPKEYKCCDCGTAFSDYTDKNGHYWTAAQMYHMAESANVDGKPRCRSCSMKAGTRKEKING